MLLFSKLLTKTGTIVIHPLDPMVGDIIGPVVVGAELKVNCNQLVV